MTNQEDKPVANEEVPEEFTLLMMLLRLVSALNNGDGEISMRGYAGGEASKNLDTDIGRSAEFLSLEAISSLLVHDDEVLSTCYTGSDQVKVTVLASPTEGSTFSDSDNLGIHVDHAPPDKMLPLRVATLSNPKTVSDNQAIHISLKGRNYWPNIKQNEWQFAHL